MLVSTHRKLLLLRILLWRHYTAKQKYLTNQLANSTTLALITVFIEFALCLGLLFWYWLTQLFVSFRIFCIVSPFQITSKLSPTPTPRLYLSEANKPNDKVNVIILGVGPRNVMLSISLNSTIGDIFEELRRRHLVPKSGKIRQVLYFDQCRHSPLRHTEVLRDVGIASLSILHLRTIILGGLDDEIDPEYNSYPSPHTAASTSSEKSPSSTIPFQGFVIRTSIGRSLSPAPFKKISDKKVEDCILKLLGRAPIIDIPGHSELWKAIVYDQSSPNMTTIPILKNEIRTYERIRHRYIASFYGVHEADDDLLALVIPWYNYNTLAYLKKYGADPLALIIQLAEVIFYLHLQGIYHGDLKASNLMVDENGDLKLIDFGLSRIAKETDIVCQRYFSTRWAPPEFFSSNDPISAASDVYSFGSTVLELLTGKYPYNKVKDLPVVSIIARGDSPRKHTTVDGCNISEGLWNIMEQCWAKPSQRPGMDEILSQLRAYSYQIKE
ncbi:hypothetical protein Clacol_002920 [Clathrus columnatus]|uniref:Protein kinase domain-containing protein n=1 Tax=Clathrus columnatus TaxID=1419009 RepID=A0AAV5A214_9AGAM|nr:hypothetical protein Clacol_002920 [Clathrus columnatus]